MTLGGGETEVLVVLFRQSCLLFYKIEFFVVVVVSSGTSSFCGCPDNGHLRSAGCAVQS
jgi:hypothetical protein